MKWERIYQRKRRPVQEGQKVEEKERVSQKADKGRCTNNKVLEAMGSLRGIVVPAMM